MEESKVTFRPWNKNDFAQVYKILQESWDKAYSSFIPKEDLTFYLNQTYNANKLEELFNNTNAFCFVSEVGGKAVGWLKLSIDNEEIRFYLSSIYVLPEFQKLKIGKQLMDIAFATAKEKEFSEIWIGVMDNNVNALHWYEKTGFTFVEKLPFKMGDTEVQHLIGKKILL
ncbi:MAG: GNAT family N-acetyltransferase [Ignavibacteriaceae bacterium]|jgi:ribosomal protein S18 acetylase RimI-like enzyme|nr:GNAT family N-acetyltransferase [Ignavibacteriaceae bacterium]